MASGMYRATQRGRNPRRARRFIHEMMKNDNFTQQSPHSVVIKYIKHQYNTNTHYLSNWNAASGEWKTTLEKFSRRKFGRARTLLGRMRSWSERHTGAQKQRSEAQCRRARPDTAQREGIQRIHTPRLLKWAQRVYVWSMKCPYSYLCLSCTIPLLVYTLFFFSVPCQQTRCKKWLCGVLLHHLHLLISLAPVDSCDAEDEEDYENCSNARQNVWLKFKLVV
jgi:hypothetical protein